MTVIIAAVESCSVQQIIIVMLPNPGLLLNRNFDPRMLWLKPAGEIWGTLSVAHLDSLKDHHQ